MRHPLGRWEKGEGGKARQVFYVNGTGLEDEAKSHPFTTILQALGQTVAGRLGGGL